MPYLTMADRTELYYRDWGGGQPIVFSHGWPLTGDEWDVQLLHFSQAGYRVIAHDRRGHGRSSPSAHGHEMDTYADDLATLMERLDLSNAVLVGHSTGGGEVARYLGRHGSTRVNRAVLLGAVTPQMLVSPSNPDGLPLSVFDEIREGVAHDRSSFYKELTFKFYNFNRLTVKTTEPIREHWWLQAMMGSIKAQYDCIAAFSATDFTADLKRIEIPVLLLHGDDDQIVPIDLSARRAVKLLRKGLLKEYAGFGHGVARTHPEMVNQDIQEFIRR